jgi:LysM repeat protein
MRLLVKVALTLAFGVSTADAEDDILLYTIKKGDSLSVIAHRMLKVEFPTLRLHAFNPEIRDWNKIREGQVIKLPAYLTVEQKKTETVAANEETGVNKYTVRPNDSLWRISKRLLGRGSDFNLIVLENGLSKSYFIFPGQVLRIPDIKLAQAPAQEADTADSGYTKEEIAAAAEPVEPDDGETFEQTALRIKKRLEESFTAPRAPAAKPR